MNRIVLIGNGFDLAHGLKTSYKNFIDWCVKQDNSYWASKMQRYKEDFNSDYVDSYKKHYHENYYVDYPMPFMLPDHIMLLSFNYTKTVHLYHNQNFFLNYIHGELDKPQNIILAAILLI